MDPTPRFRSKVVKRTIGTTAVPRIPTKIPKTLLLPDGSARIKIAPFDPNHVSGWYVVTFQRKLKPDVWKSIRHRYLSEAEVLAFLEDQKKQGWRPIEGEP
jgi:hypothetical protein